MANHKSIAEGKWNARVYILGMRTMPKDEAKGDGYHPRHQKQTSKNSVKTEHCGKLYSRRLGFYIKEANHYWNLCTE